MHTTKNKHPASVGLLFFGCLLGLSVIGILVAVRPQTAMALSGSDFQPGHIIDDAVFEDSNAMTTQDIQAFLNAKVGTCDTYGTQPSDHWNSATNSYYTHAQWGALYGNPEPFTCINEYVENPTTLQNNFSNPTGVVPGGETAATIIYNAAQEYNINPEVILVTLEKEQGLVTDNWPWYSEYQYAMGYACPDSSGCSSSSSDFYEQVSDAAWQFRHYLDNPGAYNYWIGDDYIQYNPNTSCGGSVVDIQNAATAALYIYTPYQPDAAALANVSSSNDGGTGDSCSAYGNRNFWWYFTTWFGSTTYDEPPSGLLISGNQSGELYFVTLDNNTMYHVPTWSTLQAYGLDRYQIMPMDDSDFDSLYTNGGSLTTLVYDSVTQKVYLVDNDKRYWFQSNCSSWGLDCLDSTPGDVTMLTSTYFENDVSDGGLGEPIQEYGGVYYLMQNGTKEPFVDLQTLEAMGYNSSEVTPISQGDLNSTQPLGPLQIYYPTLIQFSGSPELLYFDGQQYHHVPTMNIYNAWALSSQPVLTPPLSTLNTTLPTLSSDLSIWEQDSEGNDYLIDSGQKINISSDPSAWYSGTFQTGEDSLLNMLPTESAPADPNVNVSGAIYVVQNGALRHVPTYDDYLWLGINLGNTYNISSYTASTMPIGTDILRDGAPFTVVGNPGLYITNGNGSYHIPSGAIFSDYGLNWSSIRYDLAPDVLTAYPSNGDLPRWVRPIGGNAVYVTNGTELTISPTIAAAWGINLTSSSDPSIDLAPLATLTQAPLGQLVRDETTGGIYYGSGGQAHYVSSYATFISLGGLSNPPINVSSDFVGSLTLGSTYN
jgi:hypothetical protein